MRLCELCQERHRVLSAIEELGATISEANYRIMHIHWIEGKGFAEIAAIVGLTPKQVRDRHRRMVRKLRERLSIGK
jgi:DNA-directed RNA polymerase specialized sigma subunit